MFFKHKHLLEDLRKNGRSATAEILSMRTLGEGSSLRSAWSSDEDLSTGWMDCSMKLRVVPKDRGELPFEATVRTRIHTLKFQGGSVPVWYDPEDHSRVVVDYEADLQSHVHYRAEGDRLAHRHDQRLGMAWTPVGGSLVPVEAVLTSGKGRVTTAGKLGRLLQQPGELVVSYVRSHAAALLPQVEPGWFDHHDIRFSEPYGDTATTTTAEEAANAGAALAVALVSLLGGRMVRTDVAVTGVLAPTGELHPVSDFAKRVADAKRTYATHIVAPIGNEHDVHGVSARQREGMEFVFAATVEEALKSSLAKHAVKGFVLPS